MFIGLSTVETFQLFKARKYLEMIQKFKSVTNNEILRKLNRHSRNSGSAGTEPRKKCFVKRNNYGAVNHQSFWLYFMNEYFTSNTWNKQKKMYYGAMIRQTRAKINHRREERKRCMRALKKMNTLAILWREFRSFFSAEYFTCGFFAYPHSASDSHKDEKASYRRLSSSFLLRLIV